MIRFLNYLSLILDKRDITYIKSQKKYLDAIKEIADASIIAIDTEFIWRKTYYPVLSLIQISTKDKIYIFDFFEIKDFSDLSEILKSTKIKKVFHSLRGDISVLKSALNVKLSNVFDTQIAHSVIKNDSTQVGYKDLVQKYFCVNISKNETNSDWSKRPLDEKQINYAANDVRYLIKISELQEKKLRQLSLYEDCKNLFEAEKILGEESFLVTRLKRLKKKNKKISKLDESIFLWREKEAEKRNLPPNKIFKDRYISRLRDVISDNNFKECFWIIKDEISRERFITSFK